MRWDLVLGTVAATLLAGACASVIAGGTSEKALTPADRIATLRRAQIWSDGDVAARDIRRGPPGSGAFRLGETVTCRFTEHEFTGKSPKFQCAISEDDEVKVKYGRRNGEVYAEVAATRLLWALGFSADRMYPVRVVCAGCPAEYDGTPGARPGEFVFEKAAIERKAPGRDIQTRPDEGWAWDELDLVEEAAGGAPRSQRDALKLLAVFLQHGDNKPPQQRLVCLDRSGGDDGKNDEDVPRYCEQPFMLVQDVGLTFGHANQKNVQDQGSVNLARWSETPVWKAGPGCVGNLPKSFSGSMHDPVISEAGRSFLADLMGRLTERQIRDLFDVAGFADREFPPESKVASRGTLDEWVTVFKQKRDEIANRRCAPPFVLTAD
jgi:hypothetical protein